MQYEIRGKISPHSIFQYKGRCHGLGRIDDGSFLRSIYLRNPFRVGCIDSMTQGRPQKPRPTLG
jgi:hypothetical protein